jgi:hypothetical protein
MLSHCHCGPLVWHLRASLSSTSIQDLKQNQASLLSPQERTPTHTKNSRPPQQGHTTYHLQIAHDLGHKVHMEQLAWMLSHHIGERRVRRGYHLGMPTQRTNQLFFKPQPWQSLDQIEFTQARQKVKAQVTQLPMPLQQLTRRTSQETMLNTRRLRKISSKHLTLGNNHTDNVPSRTENHQAETTPQNPHPIAWTRKANCIQPFEKEQHA